MARCLNVLTCCGLLLPAFAWADAPDPDEPPARGQPLSFDASGGAVGSQFKVSLLVDPVEMWEGDAATLTVRISSPRCTRPPKRPRLKLLWKDIRPPLFDAKQPLLAIEQPSGKAADMPDRTPLPGIWEFDYRIRPMKDTLTRLPPLRFDFYVPPSTPGLPGKYEATYSNAMPLKVKAKAEVRIVPPPPIQVPDHILQIAEGPAVLRRQGGGHALPSLSLVVVCLLVPPLAGIGCYVAWRRLYPDAARRARIRQSQAARQALHALQKVGTGDPGQRAYRVSRIATSYMQARLGLPGAEPTPTEVALFLQRAGTSVEIAGKAAEFLRACDAARFAPTAPVGPDDLTSAATHLIQTLESEPWAAHTS